MGMGCTVGVRGGWRAGGDEAGTDTTCWSLPAGSTILEAFASFLTFERVY